MRCERASLSQQISNPSIMERKTHSPQQESRNHIATSPQQSEVSGAQLAPPPFSVSASPVQRQEKQDSKETETSTSAELSLGGFAAADGASPPPFNPHSVTGDVAQRKQDPSAFRAPASPTPKDGLPAQLKSGMEQLSGVDLSDVKVHYNSSQPAQFQAHAYAQGSDIHLGSGQEKHLPHEAWHVVQQKQGRVQPTRQLKSNGLNVNDDPQLEAEADQMGEKAMGMQPSATDEKELVQQKAISGSPIQRKIIDGNKTFVQQQKRVVHEETGAAGKIVGIKKKSTETPKPYIVAWDGGGQSDVQASKLKVEQMGAGLMKATEEALKALNAKSGSEVTMKSEGKWAQNNFKDSILLTYGELHVHVDAASSEVTRGHWKQGNGHMIICDNQGWTAIADSDSKEMIHAMVFLKGMKIPFEAAMFKN